MRVLDPPPASRELKSLAAWADRLTPKVVLQPGEGLLLEIRGSLRLFSGLAAIKRGLTEELERRRWRYRLATAPTPLAAAWLARSESLDVGEPGALAGVVGRLPLAVTGWPEPVQTLLRQMGLGTVADCLRLPRSGFARRIGKRYLDELDRALGKTPDIRTGYRAPEHLHETVELASETIDRALLGAALDGIVARLAETLRRRQAQVQEIALELLHLKSAATLTRIRFVDPVHERERMLAPLLARLERIALGGPALALTLKTGPLLPLAAAPLRLCFLRAHRAAGAAPDLALVERLRGRFGEHGVHGIGLVAEHRPELAWCRWLDRPPGPPAADVVPAAERPLWLLPEPRQKRDQKRGLTPFLSERIESGWWDGQDARRDYHVVIGSRGEKLWVYQDCRTREWYLHGLFG